MFRLERGWKGSVHVGHSEYLLCLGIVVCGALERGGCTPHFSFSGVQMLLGEVVSACLVCFKWGSVGAKHQEGEAF